MLSLTIPLPLQQSPTELQSLTLSTMATAIQADQKRHLIPWNWNGCEPPGGCWEPHPSSLQNKCSKGIMVSLLNCNDIIIQQRENAR